LLGQTCGYPFWYGLRGHVRLVATPVYAAPGCEGPTYRSAIIVRQDDPAQSLSACRGYRPAVNGRDSQSGHNALRAAAAPFGGEASFFGGALKTGAHLASSKAVAEGQADIAAIDCVTWALAQRWAPETVAGLRRIGWTPAAPALPFITAGGQEDGVVQALRDALRVALASPALSDARNALMLADVAVLREEAYAAIPAMEVAADAAGQPALL
ncbi:MAG: PhnD/SsuA/transferrin family substrate-binding protein, partial [Pseudomonadota bacterium]